MLLRILATSSYTYLFKMCVQGQIFSGYNGSVMVDLLVSALLLGLVEWHIA
jgi:hypothetical protein